MISEKINDGDGCTDISCTAEIVDKRIPSSLESCATWILTLQLFIHPRHLWFIKRFDRFQIAYSMTFSINEKDLFRFHKIRYCIVGTWV